MKPGPHRVLKYTDVYYHTAAAGFHQEPICIASALYHPYQPLELPGGFYIYRKEGFLLLHTLEGFCTYLYPKLKPGTPAFYRHYYQLERLSHGSCRKRFYSSLLLEKRGGGLRQIMAPTPYLKHIQRGILALLQSGRISPCATAYQPGKSVHDNIRCHVDKPVILKLDIHDFFGAIRFYQAYQAIDNALRESPMIGPHFLNKDDRKEDDPINYNRVLSYYFTVFCTIDGKLPQGSPASPILSNLVFFPIDKRIFSYCQKRGIAYTRYSDDMTFSGDFQPKAVIFFVRRLLKKYGFLLNEEKTAILARGQRQKITGVVVNEKPQADVQYRKKIRQELYYIKKFGAADHLKFLARKNNAAVPETEAYLKSLEGRIRYVLQLNPSDKEFQEYAGYLAAYLQQKNFENIGVS